MADFITVPFKQFDGSLTATEFNQFLEALIGDSLTGPTRGIKTQAIEVDEDSLFKSDVDIQGNLTVDGEAGPFAKFYALTNIIYVSKGGGVYNGTTFDGKSPGKALNSFQNAINNATAILGTPPTVYNTISVVCLDGAVYDEAIVCANYVQIYAPNATLKLGGTGSKQLVLANTNVKFNQIYRDTGSNPMILSTAADVRGCFLDCHAIIDNGSGAAISTESPNLFALNTNAIVINGSGIGITNQPGIAYHFHVNIKELLMNSNNSKGIVFNTAGELHGFIDGIYYENGGLTGTTGITLSGNGEFDPVMNVLKGHTAYNVSGGASLKIFCNHVAGAFINTGGEAAIATPELIEYAIADINGKELSLGNPAQNGYILSSSSIGDRSWISVPGNMLKTIYDPTSKSLDVYRHENHSGDYIDLNTGVNPASQAARISWNTADSTLNVHTGIGSTVVQVGQEVMVKVFNNNGYPLLNGKVVYDTGTGASGYPYPDLVQANNHTNLFKNLGVVTGDIASGAYGFVTQIGKVRDFNTSGLSVGPCYISASALGELTSTPPLFPNYTVSVGNIIKVGVSDGILLVNLKGNPYDVTANHWNGTIKEDFDFGVTSNGSVITGSLQKTGTGDLTGFFSSGMHFFDTTPALTITLTPGTDTVPIKNYVYIPQTTKVLTISTSGWPATEHIRIADIVLQSAATTQTRGPLSLRNWNDSLADENKVGENSHIGQWIRNRPASWYSGVEGTITIVGLTGVYFSNTSGFVYQKHLHSFEAKNTQSGDVVLFANHPTTKYLATTNISTVLVDASNVSLSGRYYNVIVWGVNNKEGLSSDKIMVNLPTGSYGNLADAVSDLSKFDQYQIPAFYNGTGFLIARFTLRHQTVSGGTWTLQRTEDLRGVVPTVGGGGIPVSGVTTFSALTDTPVSYLGAAHDIVKVKSDETGLEFINGVNGSFTTVDGKTVTVTYGIITSIV